MKSPVCLDYLPRLEGEAFAFVLPYKTAKNSHEAMLRLGPLVVYTKLPPRLWDWLYDKFG